MSTQNDVEQKILAVYDEERSLRSIVHELVALRTVHSCHAAEEIQTLRRDKSLVVEENLQLQTVIDTLKTDNARLHEDLVRAESDRERLERELEATQEGPLVDKVQYLERELSLAERLRETEAMREAQREEEFFTLVNSIRPRWREIHGVALRCIFEFLLPPPSLLHHSISNGPESLWCHMIRSLKSVALVCKSWHAVAYPLLYRDTIFRRVGQVVAFARTLRSSQGTFSPYVCSVIVTCGVPNSWIRVTRQSLEYIVASCPNLKSLSFRQVYIDSIDIPTPLPVLYTDLAPLAIPNNITHVGLFDERRFLQMEMPSFLSLAHMLSWCTHLVSLSIPTCSLPTHADTDLILHFPQLEKLSIWSFFGSNSASNNLPLAWDMPRLSALRFRPALLPSQVPSAALANFCRKHARTITHLDFGGEIAFTPKLETLDLQTAAACLCDNLSHLVLRVSETEEHSLEDVWDHLKQSPLWFKEIDLVDIIDEDLMDLEPEFLRDVTRGSAWRQVRHLDMGLLTWVPELPYLFPASNQSTTGPRLMDCYGLKIRETADRLVLEVESWEDALTGSTQSGNETIFDDGDDGESSSGDSEYQSSDSELEEDYITDEYVTDEELGELTEEEALDIYSSTLDL